MLKPRARADARFEQNGPPVFGAQRIEELVDRLDEDPSPAVIPLQVQRVGEEHSVVCSGLEERTILLYG